MTDGVFLFGCCLGFLDVEKGGREEGGGNAGVKERGNGGMKEGGKG